MRRGSRARSWLAVGACWLGMGLARADIYRLTDAAGQFHFSNVPVGKGYTLFLREPREAAPRPRLGAGSGGRPSVLALRTRREAFRTQVAGLASALQVDAALLHAVITAESAYNPKARSPKGAMGLMQLMPETARRYCVQDPYDPFQNLKGGSRYLRDLLQRYQYDPQLALAAYNAGEEAVARHGNRIPPYRETQRYVPLVMKLYEQYRRAPELTAGGVDARGGREASPPEGPCG